MIDSPCCLLLQVPRPLLLLPLLLLLLPLLLLLLLLQRPQLRRCLRQLRRRRMQQWQQQLHVLLLLRRRPHLHVLLQQLLRPHHTAPAPRQARRQGQDWTPGGRRRPTPIPNILQYTAVRMFVCMFGLTCCGEVRLFGNASRLGEQATSPARAGEHHQRKHHQRRASRCALD
jgi:hypothetical protein